jgi:glycosyltransferase involved in cell wall biosynthesis
VVSTPFGARGVDVADGVHLRFAEPERFAEVLAEVLAHPDNAHRRAEEGHRLVAERYSWDVLGAQLADLVASVAPVRSK